MKVTCGTTVPCARAHDHTEGVGARAEIDLMHVQTCIPLPRSFPTVRVGVSGTPGPGVKSWCTSSTPSAALHCAPATIVGYILIEVGHAR